MKMQQNCRGMESKKGQNNVQMAAKNASSMGIKKGKLAIRVRRTMKKRGGQTWERNRGGRGGNGLGGVRQGASRGVAGGIKRCGRAHQGERQGALGGEYNKREYRKEEDRGVKAIMYDWAHLNSW